MLTELTKMFTESLALEPDTWMILCVAIVAVAFLVTTVVGLFVGDYKKCQTLMKKVVASPSTAVASMKMMPASVKQQYKRARIAGAKPSDYVSEDVCVTNLFKRSLVSKAWLVTLVATVICAAIAAFVAPFAVKVAETNIEAGTTDAAVEASLDFAASAAPLFVVLIGGILTLISAVIGKLALSGGIKTYAKFVNAVDGDVKGAPAAPDASAAHAAQAQAAGAYSFDDHAEPVVVAEGYGMDDGDANDFAQPMGGAAFEPQTEYAAEPAHGFGEPVYGEPVQSASFEDNFEPVQGGYGEPMAATPVMEATMESDEDIRRRAREEAIAQARAAQEAEAARAAASAEAAQAAANAEAERQAQAQAAAASAAQAAAQAQAQNAAAAESSSADEVIARIDQIDREGASRETMRDVATQLQKERAKPENKTPERQKKLNEALSKLLKAMSAANRK